MLRRTRVVAHIASTPLQIHWSWPLGLVGVAGLLSPLFADQLGVAGQWGAGLVTALLIYASVLLHELAHALAGSLVGLPVRAITLFGFGGRTEVDEERLGPLAELVVAIAGPAVSLALAGAWWVASASVAAGTLQTLAVTLAVTNGSLLIFNLLPGYPLDGGRILKATLWFLLDEEIVAARSATLIARACGWALLVVGVLAVLFSGNLLYAILIGGSGMFLNRTAEAGFRQLALQRALRGIRVEDVMQRVFRAVGPDLPLDQFVGRFLLGQADQGFPVILRPDAEAPQQLLGMMTLRDLRRYALNQWTLTRVQEAMTPASRLATVSPDTAADDALRALLESGEDLLPVVGGEELLGVVRRRDLVRYIQMRVARM